MPEPPDDALVQRIENRRRDVGGRLPAKHRSELGQYFTSASVAAFLAGMLDLPGAGEVRLLDPGAGIGSLSAAVVARVLRQRPDVTMHITAFEVDPLLLPHLEATLLECRAEARAVGVEIDYDIRNLDFIEWGAATLRGSLFVPPEEFDACVMNPPYRKLNAGTAHRLACEQVGLRTTNLYTCFLGLAAALLGPGGQLSAITPRSFANGPYFEPFRQFFLTRMSLDRLHVYRQRGRVFAEAEVLQENVILSATRGAAQREVTISASDGDRDEVTSRQVPYAEVVRANDARRVIHLPIDAGDTRVAKQISDLPASLADLEISVSTGRVVDFRTRENLRADPAQGTVPLVYPGHLRSGRVLWPRTETKKPNALVRSISTERLLFPNETFVLVKRFSAKEEPKRVVAAVSRSEDLPGPSVAFENHLNVYHREGGGLPEPVALGLALFLNSSIVDQYVRQFSGHTQINATDLRELRYPDLSELEALGSAVAGSPWPEQERLDQLVSVSVRAFSSDDSNRPALEQLVGA